MQTVLTNAKLYEPTHALHGKQVDILVADHVIKDIKASVEKSFAMSDDMQVFDLAGQQISAGWIDLHVHCFKGKSEIGTAADSMGVAQGVPIIVDAGTAGAANMDDFVRYAKTQKTKIFSFINIAKTGLDTLHELRDLAHIDEAALIAKVKEYPDFIKGIKVRESGSVVGENGVEPLRVAERLAHQLSLPVMVHIGNAPPALSQVLEQMRPGDILTHCYHGKTNVNIIDEAIGHVHAFVKEAKKKEVVFDIGHGSDSFSMKVAIAAIAQGILPDTISTDMYWKNMAKPVQSLAITMGKIREAGININDVLLKVTKNPAQALNISDEYGTIAVHRRAIFTIFTVEDAPREVEDSTGFMFTISQQIKANGCFIHDEFFKVE